MAATELVPYTSPGRDESDPQTVTQGSTHTIQPIFRGRPGSVTVSIVNADDSLSLVAKLSSRPASNKVWQIHGPATYVVSVRNAGCDVDSGA